MNHNNKRDYPDHYYSNPNRNNDNTGSDCSTISRSGIVLARTNSSTSSIPRELPSVVSLGNNKKSNSNQHSSSDGMLMVPDRNTGGAGSTGQGDAPTISMTLMPLNSELQSLFECPVCIDISLPPIYQCPAGHIVCKECKGKVRGICPQCRMPLGNIRNRAMEQLASTISFPCKYKSNGCMEMKDYKSKLIHEDNCEYRPYMCPCPGASCRKPCATLMDVLNHLQTAHKAREISICSMR